MEISLKGRDLFGNIFKADLKMNNQLTQRGRPPGDLVSYPVSYNEGNFRSDYLSGGRETKVCLRTLILCQYERSERR
ncbi:MAG: hypothetical protein K5760_04090, partial [Clostridium sp.]|nr:hypothetical protein [Clostridium sp.]